MTKTELIESIAALVDTSQAAAGRHLQAFIDVLTGELAAGREVAIAGLGTFKASERAERAGRNPRTGEALTIAASTTVKFVPGAAIKSAVNGGRRGEGAEEGANEQDA